MQLLPSRVLLLTVIFVFSGLPHSVAGKHRDDGETNATKLSEPDTRSKGSITVNAKDSVPDWPEPITASQAAPNILLIMLDDVGFADTSTFGGLAQTPVLDRLAAEGLRFNQFHTTGICSPTRAALLSGRNQHRVGFGEFGGVGYPGYDGIWKKQAVSVAEVLKRNGYSTAAFGKWHNTPYHEISPIGPFDRWPTGLGFEYFYGNLLGVSSQWEPLLWRNTALVPPRSTPERGYHFTTDITDEAIDWIQTHSSLAPEKPYFVYFAPGAAHAPHHVPREWIDRYRGQFDQGWDQIREQIFARQKQLGVIPANTALTPRPKGLPAWDSLAADQKRLFSREMEIYAAFIAHTDDQIGRLIQSVKDGPHADNTLIMFIVGDNGSEMGGGTPSSELIRDRQTHMADLGGPKYISFYGSGWAWVGNTPFQWAKHIPSHLGGTRNPLVVSWPARIKSRGGLRSQFSHVTDVAATLYEVAGIKFPEVVDGITQLPLDGTSLVEILDRSDAPARHRVQYFEAEGNRAIYQDGWMASARHSTPWALIRDRARAGQNDFSRTQWELYHISKDFSQAHNVASRYPNKLRELQALFDVEARQNDVYPLGAGSMDRPFPDAKGKREFVFHGGFPTIFRFPASSSDDEWAWNFSQLRRITADVVIPKSGASGVIVAWGSRYSGMVFYVKDNRLVYENNVGGTIREILKSDRAIPPGKAELSFDFEPIENSASRSVIGSLYINGAPAGEAQFSANAASYFDGAFDIGKNSISPVGSEYELPFTFTGMLGKVTVILKDKPPQSAQP